MEKIIEQEQDHEPAQRLLAFGKTVSRFTGRKLPAECLTSSHALVKFINGILGNTGIRLTLKSPATEQISKPSKQGSNNFSNTTGNLH